MRIVGSWRTLALFVLGGIDPAQGVEVFRVYDVNSTPHVASSSPGHLIPLGNTNVFGAYTPATGSELWKTDGTEAGTEVLKDLEPGPGGLKAGCPVIADGTLYFITEPGMDAPVSPELREFTLWRSDGTASGTMPVTHIPGFRHEGSCDIVANGSTVYFIAFRQATDRDLAALWKSDGSEAGTVRVREFEQTSRLFDSHLAAANGLVLFSVWTLATGSEPWRSDGTAKGTFMLGDLRPGPDDSDPYGFAAATGDRACFSALRPDGFDYHLWCTDGTPAGTQVVFGHGASTRLSAGGTLFFDGVTPEGLGLWRTDGTPDGTQLVRAGYVQSLTEFDGEFVLSDVAETSGRSRLLRSDGTEAGTREITELPGRGVYDTFVLNGKLAFVLHSGIYTAQLWTSDGTAEGTALAYDITGIEVLGTDGQHLYFTKDDSTIGSELWVGDTQRAPYLLKNIAPDDIVTRGSQPEQLTVVDDGVYFVAQDDELRTGLWRTDGTHDGTRQVIAFSSESGTVLSSLTGFMGQLFFDGGPAHIFRKGLWRSDGTEDGTIPVLADFFGNASALAVVDQQLLFIYTNSGVTSICRSDGSVPGTSCTSTFASARGLTAVGQTAFFSGKASPPTVPSTGAELWKTDGTAAGTVLVKDIRAGGIGSDPRLLTAVGDALYFVADEGAHGPQIWKSDGTDAGTLRLTDIAGVSSVSSPKFSGLIGFREGVAFFASPVSDTAELWISDGTPGGTIMVSAFVNEFDAGAFEVPVSIGDRLLFQANDGVHGAEMWVSDGTAANTDMLADFLPGSAGSNPHGFRVVNGSAVFSARDAHGYEVWISDGTTAGTRRLTDIAPGVASSDPAGFVVLGSLVLFSADDAIKGRELWAIRLSGSGGCAGDCNGDLRVTIDELVAGVAIALGTGSADACSAADPNGSGAVTIDELIAAVHRALTGCVGS